MEILDRYTLGKELGRGGMASVYLGYDSRMERDVAIKLLPKEFLHDPQFLTRFEREAKTIASLEHPAIAPVYDYGNHEGQPFIVMRYMSGGSLADRIGENSLEIDQIASIFSRITAALDYAHKQGIVHRDLKPENILFDQHGEPYIADFGIVKLTESTSNITGTGLIGTPAFMSPEQAEGQKDLDGRSDVYSLGVILFHLLTGQSPFKADTPIGVLLAHIKDPVPDILEFNSNLPREFRTIISKVLAKDRDERYKTGGELSAALRRVVDQTSDEKIKTTKPSKPEAVEEPAPEELMDDPAKAPTVESLSKRIPVWGWGAVIVLVAGVSYALADGVSPSEETPSPDDVNSAVRSTESTSQPVASSPTVELTPTVTPAEIIYPDLPDFLEFGALTDDFYPVGDIMEYFLPPGYDVLAEMQKGPVEFKARASFTEDQKVFFQYGWCSVDQETLGENLENIDYKLTMNGQDVGGQAVLYEYETLNNVQCVSWYLIMENWEVGEHLLTVNITYSDTVDDEKYVYPAASHRMDYAFIVSEVDETVLNLPDSFEDDFSDPSTGWMVYDGRSGFLGYLDGGFIIEIKETGIALWSIAPVEYEDVIVEVDAAWVGGGSDNDFGIICRKVSSNSFYSFVITSDGLAAIQYISEVGGWGFLGNGWISTDQIKQGENEVNHIRAECIGNRLTLYINGEKEISVIDTRFSRGGVGLITTAYSIENTRILFDNFVAVKP